MLALRCPTQATVSRGTHDFGLDCSSVVATLQLVPMRYPCARRPAETQHEELLSRSMWQRQRLEMINWAADAAAGRIHVLL